jgi:DCC1-like thiol-disulfide oxidoreductase
LTSDALRIARELPRWQLTWLFHFIPRVICDAIYDLVARNRYRWFGRRDACILTEFGSFGAIVNRPETAGTMAPGAGWLRPA